MEPENLQSVLQEAGIQVDKETLQNPTEDFMIYLIIEYLNKFHFDGNEISKSTVEQLECLSCPDTASDAIRVINLHSALSAVCNEIFLKDLSLTDISCPGPKKARRHIKILFNFFAYVRNKIVENEIAFADLDDQKKHLEQMIDHKNSIIAKIGATRHERENKLDSKKRLQREIDELRLDIENNNEKSEELENHVKDVLVKHQEAFKKCSDSKAKAVKLHKITTDLQSKIVNSPEEYATRTKELEKILEIKKEERQVLNDAITRKKQQIKNNENAQELVRELNDKFSTNTSETFKQLKDTSKQLEEIKKELDLLKSDIAKWTSIGVNGSPNDSNDDDSNGHERLLFELENQYASKEREFDSLKIHLEKLQIDLREKKAMLENELRTITAGQEETSDFIKQCTEYYQNEICQELSLREVITQTIEKTDNKSI